MFGVEHKVFLLYAESGGPENSICCTEYFFYQIFAFGIRFIKAEDN